MTPTDNAFLKAITTIKSLSRGPNALAKPPPKRKVHLYGLYKQATEGDIEGIMPRPEGADPQTRANQLKWDAWKAQQGKTKQEAKLLYVGYLLETMQSLAPNSDPTSLPPQWLELEELYQQAKRYATETGSLRQGGPNHGRRLSVGSVNSSYSHFLRSNAIPSSSVAPSLRNATYSEYGLSEKDRSELQADQLVDRLQSVYPPVIPGAVPPQLPYDVVDMWPKTPAASASAAPAGAPNAAGAPGASGASGTGTPRYTNGNDPSKSPSILWQLKRILGKTYRLVYDALDGFVRRLIVDSISVISILIVLRVVASRPEILQKSKVLRVVINTMLKVGAVILDGFGIEIKLKTPRPSPSRALQRTAL